MATLSARQHCKSFSTTLAAGWHCQRLPACTMTPERCIRVGADPGPMLQVQKQEPTRWRWDRVFRCPCRRCYPKLEHRELFHRDRDTRVLNRTIGFCGRVL